MSSYHDVHAESHKAKEIKSVIKKGVIKSDMARVFEGRGGLGTR